VVGECFADVRVISCLLLVAVACVVARQALLSVNEAFPGGTEIGEVVYDLGIGYIAAWIFNVFVVILPRLHDKKMIMPGASKLIDRMCAPGLRAVPLLYLESARGRRAAADARHREGRPAAAARRGDAVVAWCRAGRLVPAPAHPDRGDRRAPGVGNAYRLANEVRLGLEQTDVLLR
jgi:hypothetical protein